MKIGGKIRNLRLKSALTQSELADRCELSKGFISQLESDQTSPSLSTLEDILFCLGSDFHSFFGSPKKEKVVYTEDDSVQKDFLEDGYSVKWLVSDAQNNDMEPILLTLEAGGATPPDDPHGGEEFGYVLSGTVYLHIGATPYRVRRGESFCFEPALPHFIQNRGKKEAKVLWISTPPSF